MDKDDDAYMNMVTAKCFANDDLAIFERRMESFLLNIFEQPLGQARRRCFYGYQKMCRDHGLKIVAIDRWLRRKWNRAARIIEMFRQGGA